MAGTVPRPRIDLRLAGAAAGLFALRLLLAWLPLEETPTFYYRDSAAHVLSGLWHAAGLLPWNWEVPLTGLLYAAAVRAGLDAFAAAWAVNIALAAVSLALFYDAVRRLDGDRTALFASALAVSVPAFSRLALSGQPEMTALALQSLAFWCVVRGAGKKESRKFALHAAALFALGAAVFARPDAMGVLFLGGGMLLWRWRESPRQAGYLAAWWLAWLAIQVDAAWGYAGLAVPHGGPDEHVFLWRMLKVPVWIAVDFFPMTLFLLPLSAALRAEAALKWLTRLIGGHALLYWMGSWFLLTTRETERNLCITAFWAMAPAAVMSARWFRGLNWRSRRVLGAAAACVLAWSWAASVRSAPEFAKEAPDRRAGRSLRHLAAERRLGPEGSLILYEAASRHWPNALVLSGRPERFRLLPTVDLEWGRRALWDETGPVGAVVIQTERGEDLTRERFRVLALIADFDAYRIYRAGPPERP